MSRWTFLGNKKVREELSHTNMCPLWWIYTYLLWCFFVCDYIGGGQVRFMWICMTGQMCALDRFTQKAHLGKPSFFPISPQPGNNSSSAIYRTSAFVPHPSPPFCATSVCDPSSLALLVLTISTYFRGQIMGWLRGWLDELILKSLSSTPKVHSHGIVDRFTLRCQWFIDSFA